MEIWEQSDEWRIAAAQARRLAELSKERPSAVAAWRRRDRSEAAAAGRAPAGAGDADARCRPAA